MPKDLATVEAALRVERERNERLVRMLEEIEEACRQRGEFEVANRIDAVLAVQEKEQR